jgi:hypothetical protein
VVLNRVRPDFVDTYFYHERAVRDGDHRRRLHRWQVRLPVLLLVFSLGVLSGATARAVGPVWSLAHQARKWASALPAGWGGGSVR